MVHLVYCDNTGKITAMAAVKSVQNYVKLSEEEIGKVLEENQDKQ